MDWDSYTIYDPGVAGPLNTLPRAEARQAYKQLMIAKPARIDTLRQLLKANHVSLGSDDATVQEVNDWFYTNVAADPQRTGRLLPEWYSVAGDIALFLGDVLIERHPNLSWQFFTWGAKNVSYQRHVIMGFSTEDPKFKTNIDLDRNVRTYGHRIIASRGSVPIYGTVTVRGVDIDVDAAAAQHRNRDIETDAFRKWLSTASRRA
jgi:hypothetical protein